jgi:hypothetical protein
VQKKVIGIDLSNIAIDNACQLAKQVHLNDIIEFICCNIYQIENYVKPNGSFIIVDFHPMLWTFDDQFEHLAKYSYFNHGQSIIEILYNKYFLFFSSC